MTCCLIKHRGNFTLSLSSDILFVLSEGGLENENQDMTELHKTIDLVANNKMTIGVVEACD
jgi:hypothetical protein